VSINEPGWSATKCLRDKGPLGERTQTINLRRPSMGCLKASPSLPLSHHRNNALRYTLSVNKRLIAWAAVMATLTMAASSPVRAGIRPSFSLEAASWKATDIVLVTEGDKIDGNFTVLDSWKGNLLPGDSVSIPGMAVYAPESSRKVFDWSLSAKTPLVPESRMILFLKRAKPGTQWLPADGGGLLFTMPVEDARPSDEPNSSPWSFSTIWLNNGNVYEWVQVQNPGPSRFVQVGNGEASLEDRIVKICKTRDQLDAALKVSNGKARVSALAALVPSDLYLASSSAVDELARCGPDAAPELSKLFHDPAYDNRSDQIVPALGAAGGSAEGSVFTKYIEDDLVYWKQEGPLLPIGWWQINGYKNESLTYTLRHRFGKLDSTIRELGKLKYKPSRSAISDLRDFWRSMPQLNDKSGLNGLITDCDSALMALSNQ
jgi:hypothetical protein